MNLIKRFPYGNEYDTGKISVRGTPIIRLVEGGVPNVPVDLNNNLEPMDNRIIGSPGNTIYKVKRVTGKVFLQDRVTNKYLTRLETLTGESLTITLPALPSAIPVVLPDGVSIKWVFPNGHTITQYATEKHVKEIVFQKKNIPIKFRYVPIGLDIVQKTHTLEFYSQKTGKLVYKTERPFFYENDDMKYVNVQMQKVGNAWEINYPNYNKDREIDPTITFGIAAGYEAGLGHKDTYVYSAGNAVAQGDAIILSIRLNVRFSLIRFDLGIIPIDAILNSALLTTTTNVNGLGGNVAIHRIITLWGITNFDAGVLENPATAGQATWRRSIDFNGAGGDQNWAVGITFSAADFDAVADDTQLLAAPLATNTFDVLNTAQGFIDGTIVNNGWAFVSAINNNDSLRSLDEAVPANRPYLTVDYDVPAAPVVPMSQRISRIAIHNSIGIK